MKKQVFSILLTAALLVGMMPASVLAETEERTAQATAVEAEESAVEAEDPALIAEESAPDTEGPASETEEPAPEAGETVPEPEEMVPEAEETAPELEEPATEAEDKFPEAGETAAEAEETAPAEEKETSLPEAETAEKSEEKRDAGIRPLADDKPLADKFVTITWTGPEGGERETYVQGATTEPGGDKKDNDAIRGITDGLWWVEIAVASSVDGNTGTDILTDGHHDYQMVLPQGDVGLIFGKHAGGDVAGNISWTLDEDGTIHFQVKQVSSSQKWVYSESFAVGVTDDSGQIPGGMPEEALDAAILKTGTFDAAACRIYWDITARIPAYNGGRYPVWNIQDDESYFNDFGILGDLETLSVFVKSSGYTGEIRPVEEAGEDDVLAYTLTAASGSHPTIDSQTLYLANRCQCVSGSCADWQNGQCGKTLKEGWCTCWRWFYNTEVTIHCSVDATEVLQGLEEANWDGVFVDVTNRVILHKDGVNVKSDNDSINLKKLFTKSEDKAPHNDNAYTGSYTITVNPNQYDYSLQDTLTITDTMQGMTYLADRPFSVVTGQENALTKISEEEAKDIGRAGNEDQYYSLSEKNLTDAAGDVTGDLLTITIWYPTDLTYEISYEAKAVITEKPDEGGGVIAYGNTAAEGDIFVEVTGSYTLGDESEDWEEKRVILTKVDAGDAAVKLGGAVFDAYLYRDGTEDYYLNSLTTDADGVGTLISQGPEVSDRPYMLSDDTLYYVLERQAPAGYQPNPARYWFYWSEGELPPEALPPDAVEGVNLFRQDPTKDQTLAFTVEDERVRPKITKEILEDDYERKEEEGLEWHAGENTGGDGWGSWDDADNRQAVLYRLRLTEIRDAVNLTVHDYLEKGLTLAPDTVAASLFDPLETVLRAEADYTVTYGTCSDPACPMEGCTFEVHLKDQILSGLSDEAYLLITYQALTDTAPDDYDDYRDEILNRAYLTSGASPAAYVRSEILTTETDLFGFGFFKYAEETGRPTALAGAKFLLTRAGILGDGSKGTLFATFESREDSEGQSYYLVNGWTDQADEAAELISPDDGRIRILGLDDDRYSLQEIAAPAGYELLTEAIQVTIAEDGSVTVDGSSAVSKEEELAKEFWVVNLPLEHPKPGEEDKVGGVKTGDNPHIGLWLVLLAAALAGLLAGIRMRRKKF